MLTPAARPLNIQIEPVYGCNLKCSFCGLRALPDGEPHRFMDVGLAHLLAKKFAAASFDPLRVELAGRGEPLLHPNILDIVAAFGSRLPNSQINVTTNGTKLGASLGIRDLQRAGVTMLVIDAYGKGTVDKYMAKFAEHRPTVYGTMKGDVYNPWLRSTKRDRVVIMPDISLVGNKTTRALNNRAGSASVPVSCPIPWEGRKCFNPSKQLDILWDGSIALCCHDYSSGFTHGMAQDIPDLADFWRNGRTLNRVRSLLGDGKRAECSSACAKCSYHGGFARWPRGKRNPSVR